MRYTVENEFLRVEVDSLGAELASVVDKASGAEMLWQGDPAYWPDRALNLFPYVARLTEGSYYLDGRLHRMEIHGIAPYRRFRLAEQRDDVLNSKRELESVIRDIVKEMTTIFVTEFGKIDHYFGQTFEEMFGGGKGQLILEDPENPLTCGIEIRVQPPGKQVKTITLLSGGEKAFVATALYFAILKVRPTPFCLLDEIDAALDDRNVERFASYLHNLARQTQFIVITHRRGTMEAADVLYGVTMQEQGVSKLLRLDLNQMEQYLGLVE